MNFLCHLCDFASLFLPQVSLGLIEQSEHSPCGSFCHSFDYARDLCLNVLEIPQLESCWEAVSLHHKCPKARHFPSPWQAVRASQEAQVGLIKCIHPQFLIGTQLAVHRIGDTEEPIGLMAAVSPGPVLNKYDVQRHQDKICHQEFNGSSQMGLVCCLVSLVMVCFPNLVVLPSGQFVNYMQGTEKRHLPRQGAQLGRIPTLMSNFAYMSMLSGAQAKGKHLALSSSSPSYCPIWGPRSLQSSSTSLHFPLLIQPSDPFRRMLGTYVCNIAN